MHHEKFVLAMTDRFFLFLESVKYRTMPAKGDPWFIPPGLTKCFIFNRLLFNQFDITLVKPHLDLD